MATTDRFSYELFAGCGGAGTGMTTAGYTSIGGIEYHHPAADIYDANHDIPLTRANILDIGDIPTVDLLWASPPCPSYSIANINRGETEKDINLATHIARLMVESRPRSIAIENVRGYWGSESCNSIISELTKAGYHIQHSIECAADYGAATTRQRLIVRASLDPIRPLIKTHRKMGSDAGQLSLFDRLPSWVSWYDAIESFIHTLPKSTLTANQSAALAKRGLPLPLLIDSAGNGYNSSYTTRAANDPAYTLTASISKHPARILVDLGNPRGGKYTVLADREPSPTITAVRGSRVSSSSKILIERLGYRGEPNIYPQSKPCPTIRAATHIDDHGCYRVAANVIDGFDCFAADIRCLAAWQGFKNYKWGLNKGEAGRAIGNAVPPPLARAIALSFGN